MPKGFQKGIATNPSGKKPGTQNKTTRDIKEAYRMLIENNLDNLTCWLEQIAEENPEKAIKIISELSEYVIPKLARTDLTSGDKPIQPNLNITVDSSETAETLKRLRDELKNTPD
jgi:hypothetical protein